MKLCELCELCENKEKKYCQFRPHKVIHVEEVSNPNGNFSIPLYLWDWECLDFITKKEYERYRTI